MTASLQTKQDRPNYFVVLAFKDSVTGKNKTKWISTGVPVKGNNKHLAKERMYEELAKYQRYQDDKVDFSIDTMFVAYLESWLVNMKHSIEPTTYEAYKRNIDQRIIPYFKPLKLSVRDVTPAHIQHFVNHCLETVSTNTVHRYLANISKCLNTAVKQNMIAFNPVSRIDKPKKVTYRGVKFYNGEQISELLKRSKGDALEIIILLTIFYGLRRSEVLGLKWDAVDFQNDNITIRHTVVPGKGVLHKKESTKNESSYDTMPMPEMIKAKLKSWKEKQAEYKLFQPSDYNKEEYVCTHANGVLIRPGYVSQHFKVLLKNINMPHIRFHDLRHSSASYLLSQGFSMKEIQTWLRHKDIQTTMNIYTHIDMSAQRGIAENLNAGFGKNFRHILDEY